MTRLVRFSNNAVSRLAANITNASTTISLTPGDGAKFPVISGTQFFMATLIKSTGETEIVKVTARATDTLTVVRAAEPVGATQVAYAFSAGDRIEQRLTAKALSDELDRLDSGANIGATNKTADYTVQAADVSTLIRVDTTAGAITITLPEIASLADDFDIMVAKVTDNANAVNIVRAGSTDLINGATSYPVNNQWQSAWLIADRLTNTWTAINSGAATSTIAVDTFTGDGTAGPYTLSGDPVSKANTAVYLSGVYQQKATYTLAGTSLTMGGNVPVGVTVEVVWSRPLSIGRTGSDLVTYDGGTVQDVLDAVTGSNGAASVGYTPAGTGAVAATVQAKLRERVSVLDFYANGVSGFKVDPTGVIDSTAGIQAAANFAALNNSAVYVPAGLYKISSTINFGAISVIGDGLGSKFVPTITNGSPAIIFTSPNSYWSLENITVWADFSSGYKNCTGIQIGGEVGSSSYANRYHVKNVLVHGCKTGATINGYIGELDIFVQFCETGINGSQVNGANVRLKVEQCVNAGSFKTCVGSNFHLMFEGGAVLVNGFSWDECNGCTWTAPYFETLSTGMSLAYFMKFGATTECQAVKIVGGTTFAGEVSDAYWVFDRVHGLDVDQHWCVSNAAASLGKHVRTTANTKQINKLGFRFNPNSGVWLSDNSLSPRSYKNLVCNSDFRAGFKGFRSVGVTGSAVLSVESAVTRGTGTAIKITAPVGATTSTVAGYFRLPDSLLNAYKGKRLFLGMWLFVPDITEYSSLTNKSPAIALNDGTGSTLSPGGYLKKGSWNFVHVERTISASATELTLFAYPLNYVSGYTSTGNEYVIVGEVFVINAPSEVIPSRVASGYVSEDGGSGLVVGENVVVPGTAAPSGTVMSWKVGDRVFNTSPAVGQPKGWVCTVAGSPGTWVSEGNL